MRSHSHRSPKPRGGGAGSIGAFGQLLQTEIWQGGGGLPVLSTSPSQSSLSPTLAEGPASLAHFAAPVARDSRQAVLQLVDSFDALLKSFRAGLPPRAKKRGLRRSVHSCDTSTFLELFQPEMNILNAVHQQVARQVEAHCVERGRLLRRIAARQSALVAHACQLLNRLHQARARVEQRVAQTDAHNGMLLAGLRSLSVGLSQEEWVGFEGAMSGLPGEEAGVLSDIKSKVVSLSRAVKAARHEAAVHADLRTAAEQDRDDSLGRMEADIEALNTLVRSLRAQTTMSRARREQALQSAVDVGCEHAKEDSQGEIQRLRQECTRLEAACEHLQDHLLCLRSAARKGGGSGIAAGASVGGMASPGTGDKAVWEPTRGSDDTNEREQSLSETLCALQSTATDEARRQTMNWAELWARHMLECLFDWDLGRAAAGATMPLHVVGRHAFLEVFQHRRAADIMFQFFVDVVYAESRREPQEHQAGPGGQFAQAFWRNISTLLAIGRKDTVSGTQIARLYADLLERLRELRSIDTADRVDAQSSPGAAEATTPNGTPAPFIFEPFVPVRHLVVVFAELGKVLGLADGEVLDAVESAKRVGKQLTKAMRQARKQVLGAEPRTPPINHADSTTAGAFATPTVPLSTVVDLAVELWRKAERAFCDDLRAALLSHCSRNGEVVFALFADFLLSKHAANKFGITGDIASIHQARAMYTSVLAFPLSGTARPGDTGQESSEDHDSAHSLGLTAATVAVSDPPTVRPDGGATSAAADGNEDFLVADELSCRLWGATRHCRTLSARGRACCAPTRPGTESVAAAAGSSLTLLPDGVRAVLLSRTWKHIIRGVTKIQSQRRKGNSNTKAEHVATVDALVREARGLVKEVDRLASTDPAAAVRVAVRVMLAQHRNMRLRIHPVGCAAHSTNTSLYAVPNLCACLPRPLRYTSLRGALLSQNACAEQLRDHLVSVVMGVQ